MFKYVGTISVPVSDQDKALDFYVNVLGLEKTSDEPMSADERWLVVTPPGAQTGIMLGKASAAGRMGQFTGYIFHPDDITATCETLAARGVHFTAPLRVEPWGKWAQFADPDGNEFGVWAPADGAS